MSSPHTPVLSFGLALLIAACNPDTTADLPAGDDGPVPGDATTLTCVACSLDALRCLDADIEVCAHDADANCTFWETLATCTSAEVCLDGECLPGRCSPGDRYACQGACLSGSRPCVDGGWGACELDPSTGVEVCDGVDNDCDGVVDDLAFGALGNCPEQRGVCAGSLEVCGGTAGPICDDAIFAQNAAAAGLTYEAGEESLCDGEDNDCDGLVDEQRQSDAANCGVCARACAAGQACLDGACACVGPADCAPDEICDLGAGRCDCAPGSHRCDGLCVTDDDPAHCGDRCLPCPGPDGATITCDGVSCGLACPVGEVFCDGFCVDEVGCSPCVPCAPGPLVAAAGDQRITLSWPDRSVAAVGPLPESTHPYANDLDQTWVYRLPGASGLTVRFAAESALEEGWDWLHVADGDDLPIAGSPFTGTELSGVELVVPGDTVRVRLDSGLWTNDWGFRVAQVVDETGGGAVAGYRLYWSTSPGVGTGDALLDDARPPLLHDGRTNGVDTYYKVAAVGSAADSALSNEAGATPASGVATFQVGGSVSGMIGSGLTLSLNHGESLSRDADGSFLFTAGVDDGADYAVHVTQAPTAPAQRCQVVNGAGTIAGAAVADIEVVCSLQIATFNLAWFDSQDSAAKMQGIADIVLDNGFDLVGVQEVNSGQDLAAWIDAYLDADLWGYHLGTSGGSLRVGFIYRRAVIEVEEAGELNWTRSSGFIDQTTYPWDGYNRLPYWGRLAVPGGATRFQVVVLHLKASGDSASCNRRAAQAEDVAAWLADQPTTVVLTIGDYNDRLAGDGMCGSSDVDTLAAFQTASDLVFVTEQPNYMADDLFTYLGGSTLDHITCHPALLPRLYELDAAGHLASVVEHGNELISDHQPPFVWLALD